MFFKYLVMFFGFTNVFLFICNFFNNRLYKKLDSFYTIYINNILIYNNFKKKHQIYIQIVLTAL